MIRSGYHELWDVHMEIAPLCARRSGLARIARELNLALVAIGDAFREVACQLAEFGEQTRRAVERTAAQLEKTNAPASEAGAS